MRTLSTLAAVFALAIGTSVYADDYEDARKPFQNAEQSGQFFPDAYGYALFPTIGKGGIGVGGAHGRGRAYVDGEHVGDVRMTQLTVGFQLGGQAYSMIVFFPGQAGVR